ncbi:MAG: tetratricopeptide repeat protein [Bryobacteraceae bacterium]|jgi:tetratricopeptide (TPR) repeat protein
MILHSYGAEAVQYEVSGRITPQGPAQVTLFGTAQPFAASAEADQDGRFRFKKIEAGSYTVAVLVAGRGEARRTIEVGPSMANPKRRVWLDLNFADSDFVLGEATRRQAVTATQLAIPDKAMRDYADARKALSRHDGEAAARSLEHAVELAPGFADAWNELGTIAYQTRRYGRAAECFRRALAADPGAYEPLVNLGGVLIGLHELEEALDDNLRAVLTRPNDPLANSQLGRTYFEVGNYDLALKYLTRTVSLDPAHFSTPQLVMAEIHLRRHDRRAAADDLENFLKYHPDWPRAAKMRAEMEEWRNE